MRNKIFYYECGNEEYPTSHPRGSIDDDNTPHVQMWQPIIIANININDYERKVFPLRRKMGRKTAP